MKATAAVSAMSLVAVLSTVDALRINPSTIVNRRTAFAALAAVPAAAQAAEFTGYKERNYGNGYDTSIGSQKQSSEPEKKKRCRPDGYGGRKCDDDEVKPVTERIGTAVFGGDAAPASAPVAKSAPAPAPAKKAVVEPTNKELAKTFTVDEMIENSIVSKEKIVGRELSADEKAVIASKVKALMGA